MNDVLDRFGNVVTIPKAVEDTPAAATSLRDQFNGDWDRLEKELPGLIASTTARFFARHQREGYEFAIEVLAANQDARGARILRDALERLNAAKRLTSTTPVVEEGT